MVGDDIQAHPVPRGPRGEVFEHHAFLCYTSADKAVARVIYHRLRAAGLSVWMDEAEVGWGDAIRTATASGIARSRHLILLLSRAALTSEWGSFELLIAASADPANRGRRLLPLRLDDEPIPDHVAAFRYLPFRNKDEEELAWPTIVATLRGEAGGLPVPRDDDAPFVHSRHPHQGLISRYRALLRHQHHDFEVHGLGLRMPLRFAMAQTWVSVQLGAIQQDPVDPIRAGSAVELALMERALGIQREVLPCEQAFTFARDRFRAPQGIVVLGDPGSGKTTLLRRLLLTCLESGSHALGLPPDLVPLWLPLRMLADTERGLETFIASTLREGRFVGDLREVGALLERDFKLLLLLDGLDEVVDEERRLEVLRWIDDARSTRPNWYFAVTSRFSGWEAGDLGPSFIEFQLLPFSEGQARQFVGRWFTGVLCRKFGHTPQAAAQAQGLADDLWARLSASERRVNPLLQMSANPLLLSNLCLIHYKRRELPRERAEVYEQCVQILLEVWQQAKDLSVPWTAEECRQRLEPVAWRMMAEGVDVVGEERLGQWLAEAGEGGDEAGRPGQRRIQAEREARRFLGEVRDRSGLVVGWSQRRYGFLHKTFQEYLAARHAVRGGLLEQLADRFGEDEWREVILLVLALSGPDPGPLNTFVRRVLYNRRLLKAPELMAQCMDEASGLSSGAILGCLEDPDTWQSEALVGECLRLLRGRFEWDSDKIVAVLQKLKMELPLQAEGTAPKRRRAVLGLIEGLLAEHGVEDPVDRAVSLQVALRAAAEGDPEARARIMDACHSAMEFAVLRALGWSVHPEILEEVVQQSQMELAATLDLGEDLDARQIVAVAEQIARREASKVRRADSASASALGLGAVRPSRGVYGPLGSRHVSTSRALARRVAGILLPQLTAPQRAVFRALFIEGVTAEEAGQQLGLPEEAVVRIQDRILSIAERLGPRVSLGLLYPDPLPPDDDPPRSSDLW